MTERNTQKGDVDIGGVLLILAFTIGLIGFLFAETQTTSACRDFGKFTSLGNVYVCTKVEKK